MGQRETGSVTNPEEDRTDGLLDWVERTMDAGERERMLALPDHDPSTPEEVERQQAVGRLLASLPPMTAPEGLWANVRDRIEALPTHRPRLRRRLRSGAIAGLAAAVLVVVSWLVLSRHSGVPGGRIQWVVVDDPFSEAVAGTAEEQASRALVGESWMVDPVDLYSRLDARGDR